MRILPEGAAERRRTVGLLVLLAALVVWVWWPSAPVETAAPAGSGAAVQPGAGPSAQSRAANSLTLPERVRLDALTESPEPFAVGRNLFRFGARPAPPPPPPAENPVYTPAPPPRPTGPPPVPLQLTGRFEGPDGRVIVTLKDTATGALFHASEGEIVDGRYRLLKVGVQSVVVAYLDGSGQRTIALGG